MTNYRFPLWLYLYRLVGHNLGVAYRILYNLFYVLFDKLEMHWYMWRKKGDVKAYHIEKLSQSIKMHGTYDLDVFMTGRAYLKRFGYTEKALNSRASFFHYELYNWFFFDRYRVMASYLYFRIKDAGSLIDMSEALDLTDSVKACRIFGKDEYDRMRKLSVTELYRLLQQESEQSN